MKFVKQVLVLCFVCAFVLQACGLPSALTGGEPTATPVATQVAIATEQQPAQVEIVHALIPGGAESKDVANAHDNEESNTYDSKSILFGDDFNINRFERPFTSVDMAYLPQVDIVDIGMTEDDNYYYVHIKLAGVDLATGGANGSYAVDFDTSIDGKAEFIIIAQSPASAEWSTDGVSIHADENSDVGGQSLNPDTGYTGDGFEKIVFNSGTGNDPDAAWSRFVNEGSPVVEIAFKKSFLAAQPKFMWSVTASLAPIDPTKFYYNDTYTVESAGSPVLGEQYPVKDLAGVDNTCRLPAGFQATGTEPLGCHVGQQVNEGEPAPSGNFTPVFNICVKYPALCNLQLVQPIIVGP